jgi:uncharacterized protein (DUF2235 family)
MAKNILIFSDGTGQAGGLMPDERRSNVYKLFRATRCGPDSSINPTRQLAFYDPGLGSKSDDGGATLGTFGRRVYDILSQATGLGITRNIIDCYAAIVRMWEPGDCIYLFGFSRGAYTVRCLAAVLKLCGVPTRMADGMPLKRDPASSHAIAAEAVKHVYQFGASKQGDPYKQDRLELAARFRHTYGSGNADNMKANAVPYFIGVWDTVAALGVSWKRLFILGIIGVTLIGLMAWLFRVVISVTFVSRFVEPVALHVFWYIIGLAALAGTVAYLVSHLKFATAITRPWYKTIHFTGWRMRFYDRDLDPDVQFARHALSIDENRADFDRVPWTDHGLRMPAPKSPAPDRLQQIWFCGVHSDVGGSYPENESRLSDISLNWMVEQATGLPEPILTDLSYLSLWPSSAGMQHDARKEMINAWPSWVLWLLLMFSNRDQLGWALGYRTIPHDAPLHPSVIERFQSPSVLHYDVSVPYRPWPLREHEHVKVYYMQDN